MDNKLNKEILRLAIPSILANVTIPLVGMVDTAIAGHIDGSSAVFIGAIALGSTIFNLLYWNISFLKSGTGGLTAQAYGRDDKKECARIFARAELLAIIFAAAMILLQWPIAKIAVAFLHGTPQAEELILKYFYIRIWAAPATLSLMAFSGWFIGMQDSTSSMWKDLIVNGVNIAASIFLAFRAGMGFSGIVWGTVTAQYTGLLFCALVLIFKYRELFRTFRTTEVFTLLSGDDVKTFFKMNLDLVGRSIGFCVIYLGYNAIAARYGDFPLACSAVLMQILMIFSYFSDGFAYAGEALSGRFIGARDNDRLNRTIRYIFVWGGVIAILFMVIYGLLSAPALSLLTNDTGLVSFCMQYLPWMLAMPPLGCAAFLWDGIFLGATATKYVRNAMVGAMVLFLSVWILCKYALTPEGGESIHCLMAAYFVHLAFRALYLTFRRKKITVNPQDSPSFSGIRHNAP